MTAAPCLGSPNAPPQNLTLEPKSLCNPIGLSVPLSVFVTVVLATVAKCARGTCALQLAGVRFN